MKVFSFVQLMTGFLLVFFTASFSYAAGSENNKIELVDIVYEWSLEGGIIQVGDYTIDRIESVYEDHGDGGLVQSSKKRISVGNLVKAVLVRRDENGTWQAERIVIFSGEGLKDILQTFSEEKRKDLLSSLKSFNSVESSEKKAAPQQQDLHLENGVWVN